MDGVGNDNETVQKMTCRSSLVLNTHALAMREGLQ